MTPEALRIAQQLAQLLRGEKSVIHSSSPEAENVGTPAVLCTNLRATNSLVAPPASVPLNDSEREFAREITQRLRDFYVSRYYARLRIRERRRLA